MLTKSTSQKPNLSFCVVCIIQYSTSLNVLPALQALAASETAYAHAMTMTSSIPLPGECDGDTMKAALNSFSALPQVGALLLAACTSSHHNAPMASVVMQSSVFVPF